MKVSGSSEPLSPTLTCTKSLLVTLLSSLRHSCTWETTTARCATRFYFLVIRTRGSLPFFTLLLTTVMHHG